MAWILLLLACVGTPPEPVAPSPDPVDAERVRLHEVERHLLAAEAEKRLAQGDLQGALVPITAAEPVGGLPELRQRLVDQAEGLDPALAGAVHLSLAEAIRSDAEASGRHASRARDLLAAAEIRARYAPEAREASLARTAGVTRPMLEAAVRSAVDQHVRPPAPAEIARSGARRLEALAEDPGALEAFPRLAELREPAAAAASAAPAELAGAIASGLALVDAGARLGLPPEWLVAEWVDGALSGFDAWTRVAWPAELAGFEAHHSGVTVGIGLELEAAEGAVYASLPVPEGPAWRAGVHRGDRLIAVVDSGQRNGVQGVDAARAALVGEPDSELALVVARGDQELELSMKREPVRQQTVHGWTLDEANRPVVVVPGTDALGFVRIEAFRPYTDEELAAVLEGAELKGLVVDLRGNGGGDVQAAANSVDLFSGEGVVATLEGPGAPPPPADGEVAWNALVPGGPWEELALVVLVDRDTASAAELMAGALSERENTTVVGERTWGKGWSQGLKLDEAHGFALQVTNAAWRLPDGRMLQRTPGSADWGVVPDVELIASAAETWQNTSRRRALEFPRTHADGSPMPPPDFGHREGLPVLPEDPAIRKALSLLR